MELETWGKVQRTRVRGKAAARVYYRDADGVRRDLLRTGRSHAEAERHLVQALRERLTPTYEIITPDTRLSDLASQWLEEIRREKKATATIGRYESTVRNHVLPVGALRVREATVPRCQRLANRVSDTAGPAAARMLLVVLKGMFGLAIRCGASPMNPIDFVKAPPRERKPVRAPQVEQIHRLRELLAAHDARHVSRGTVIRDLGDIVDIMIATGARIGEVLALRWADIDLTAGWVTIDATVTRIAGRGLIIQENPKTETSTRRLSLPQFAHDVLVRRRVVAYCELVFPSATGTPRWPENIRTQWRNALHGTDMAWMTPTSCRKAVATLLESKVDIEAAAGQLGHATSRVTNQFYVPPRIERPDYSEHLDELGAGFNGSA